MTSHLLTVVSFEIYKNNESSSLNYVITSNWIPGNFPMSLVISPRFLEPDKD